MNTSQTVIGGMLAASAIAIFLIPVTFYVIERLFTGQQPADKTQDKHPAPKPPAPAQLDTQHR